MSVGLKLDTGVICKRYIIVSRLVVIEIIVFVAMTMTRCRHRLHSRQVPRCNGHWSWPRSTRMSHNNKDDVLRHRTSRRRYATWVKVGRYATALQLQYVSQSERSTSSCDCRLIRRSSPHLISPLIRISRHAVAACQPAMATTAFSY